MRRLASIQKIEEIKVIPDADKIVAYRVGGWWVVDQKDKYSVGDLVIYAEVDSWIPYELAPFLCNPDRGPREFEGVKGERLRTIRLRGQISQGLLLPITVLKSFIEDYQQYHDLTEDEDVTDILGILKYEKPLPANLAGLVKGNFPSFIPKTDEERVQNLKKEIEKWSQSFDRWEVSEKLDGSSMTVFFRNNAQDEEGNIVPEFGVCSRNMNLRESEGNSFWEVANRYAMKTKLPELNRNIAIQGELIGEGIQGNKYKLTGQDFFVFRMYDIDNGVYLSSKERMELCDKLGLRHVPVLHTLTLINYNIDAMLTLAEGKSKINPKTEREGIVFKNIENPQFHFKAISNSFLIKNQD